MNVRRLGQGVGEAIAGLVIEGGQLGVRVADRVGRDHARTAGVRDDSDAVGVGDGAAGKHRAGVEEGLRRVDADRARLLQAGLVGALAAGDRPGV